MQKKRVLVIFALLSAMTLSVLWLGSVLAAASLTFNEGLTVNEAASGTITNSLLQADDPAVTGEILTYTLVTTPTNGLLALNGTTLNPTAQFTQADIDSNLLVYTHNDSETLGDSFDFTVATITDTIPQTSFLITVTPIFDQVPVVLDQVFSVAENSPMGTAVNTILASDLDAGDSLTYTIIAGNTGNPFAVGSGNGAITVDSPTPLDFETNESLTFTVQVEDRGTLMDTAVITVNINNVNEAPIVNPATLTVDENSPNGTSVGLPVTATDPEMDSLTFSIIDGDPNNVFDIDPISGQITVTNSSFLNFEALGATPHYTLTVQASDSALTGTAIINININNVNEAPIVNPATLTVDENSPNGTSVDLPVTATDPEMDSLTFSIIDGDPNNVFDIGPTSGQIIVTNSSFLNFEALGTTPHYSLTVLASDSLLTGTAVIEININNINEIPTVNTATFSVQENSSIGTSVGTVIANDPEGPVTFEILTSGNTNSAFAINPNNGLITVNNSTPLNFEVTPTFNLTVRVTDNGTPSLPAQTNTASITINLTNKNEMPTVNDATFSISEDSQNGAVVGTVSASDPDAGDSLTFSFTGTGTAFAINPSTGQITVNDSTQLNADTMPTYNLTVQVLDSGNLPDTATITINVSALPVTNVYLPMVLNNYPPIEPNNNCTQAYSLGTGINYEFTADDQEDWYAITLTSQKNVSIVLSSFEPAEGQLVIYGGSCNSSGGGLTSLQNNGSPSSTKTITLNNLGAGTYYIRVYSVPATNTTYNLQVNFN